MGMRASIMVIGPLGILREHDALMYDDDYYEGCDDDMVVVGHLIGAVTTHSSRLLAQIAGVDPWDFSTHHITSIPADSRCGYDETIDEVFAVDVHLALVSLAGEVPYIDIWYLPNG